MPKIFFYQGAQSRQSAKLFLQSLDLGLPHPLSRRRVCPPPPFGPGGRAHSLAGEGLGESQFRRGDIHCGALYIYVLCAGLRYYFLLSIFLKKKKKLLLMHHMQKQYVLKILYEFLTKSELKLSTK
jgi:hypothetical protein